MIGDQKDPLADLTIDFAALKRLNSETRGWLQGLSGDINYPVAQHADNDYYLSHLINGSENGCGTLFVDYRNRFLVDDVTLIYGHHMKNGAMFGNLENYKSRSYYNRNPIFNLYTEDKKVVLEVFAAIYTNDTEAFPLNYATAADFNAAMTDYIARSRFASGITPVYGDHLVFLYTCSYNEDDGRFVVMCRVAN